MPTILDHRGNPISTVKQLHPTAYVQHFRQRLTARYDAAQTTDENERHWANADYLSPHHAMSPMVRRKLASRARYEAQENNSYAKGMVLTLSNDLVGTGPRLQLQTKDREGNRRVERAFARWAAEIRLAEKLRTMSLSKIVDGETFAVMSTNPMLASVVQLDVKPIEAERVGPRNYYYTDDEEREYDGIKFDEWGNPVSYHVYDRHPGSTQFATTKGTWVDSEHVIHRFRVDRPGQVRGITELATALPLFAMLRRFTLATLAAAETAADFAAVMRTSANAMTEAENLPKDQWFDAIPIEYRAMLTLPNGWDITQLKAEHPATTYEMFKREIINEIARCLNMPFNVAAANSAEYNYASGRMDHQVYFRSIEIEQDNWACGVLDRIFYQWLEEAMMQPGLLPVTDSPFAEWDWRWFWDGQKHVDPQKEANALDTNLSNYSESYARHYAKQGLDWEEEMEQVAREREFMRSKNLTEPGAKASAQQTSDEEEAAAA